MKEPEDEDQDTDRQPPDEELVADARAGLTPSDFVELKLLRALGSSDFREKRRWS